MTTPSDTSADDSRLDAPLPPEMARRAEEVGTRKAALDTASIVGARGTAVLVYLGVTHRSGNGAFRVTALAIAHAKVELGFIQAIALGVLCNTLVCLAVWLTLSARTIADRILAIVPPISAFEAAGFEHSVANMYFVLFGLFITTLDPGFAAAAECPDTRPGAHVGSLPESQPPARDHREPHARCSSASSTRSSTCGPSHLPRGRGLAGERRPRPRRARLGRVVRQAALG